MPTVTVPGASGTIISETYNSLSAGLTVAQQIAAVLASDSVAGNLFVQNSDMSPGAVPPGDVGELAVTLPSASQIILPGGYSYTAVDQSVPGPLTISGGGSLFVGNQSVTYYGASGPVSIAAGDGNDLISLTTGSTYDVGLGNGSDTIFANGTGTVTGGTGSNIFYANGANQIFSYGSNDTIVSGIGSVTVNTYGPNPVVFGGPGALTYFGGSAGAPTIYGGSGGETLFGGTGQNITYLDGSNTSPTGTVFAAGAGNETLNAGGSHVGISLAGSTGTDVLIGSTTDDIFYGSPGHTTMTGNGGDDSFIFGFSAANASSTDIITDFSSTDNFVVVGYGAGAAANALAAATVSGGNTFIKLSDGTSIEFQNVSDPTTIHNQSF